MASKSDRTIVLDMHGILYAHAPDFNMEKSSERIRQEVERYRQDYPQLEDALDIEWDSIQRGSKDQDFLQIYFFPGALARAREIFGDGDKVVVCANSRVEEQRFVIDRLFEKAGFRGLAAIDFYDFSGYGDKKDPLAWQKILGRYGQIDEIYEDKGPNLAAARTTAESLGFKKVICRNSLD